MFKIRPLALAPFVLLLACGAKVENGETDTLDLVDVATLVELVNEAVDYPALPADATSALYVVANATPADANGSLDHPFPTISQAILVASPGDAVLVAPGVYQENLTITQGPLAIIGSDEADTETTKVTLEPPGTDAAIYIDQAHDVTLRGLTIQAPSTAGIWLQGGSAVVEGCLIEESVALDDGLFGFGILATAGADIEVRNSSLSGSASVGIMLSSSTGVVAANRIEGNGGGGIRVEESSGTVIIEDNDIIGNEDFGIGIFSSSASLLSNLVEGSLAGGPSGSADGIVATALKVQDGATLGPSQVDIGNGNIVTGNQRVGILLSGETTGTVDSNQVVDNSRGGIWIQDGAGGEEGVLVKANDVLGNHFIGIGISSGSRAVVSDNAVADTLLANDFNGPQMVQIGDGVGVFGGSSALIKSNTVSGSGRIGIILDSTAGGASCSSQSSSSGSAICGNKVQDNQHGIVLQSIGVETPTTEANTLSGNTSGDTLKMIGPDEESFKLLKEVESGFGDGQNGLCLPPDCLE